MSTKRLEGLGTSMVKGMIAKAEEATEQSGMIKLLQCNLVPDWSDRCISCKYLDDNNVCGNLRSSNCMEKITLPKSTKCEAWRYRF